MSKTKTQNVLANRSTTATNESTARQPTPGWKTRQLKENALSIAPKSGYVDPSGNIQNPNFDFDETFERK